jgi:hypothetical protein
LIHIKASSGARPYFLKIEQDGFAMPTESAIVVAGIVLVFAVFAVSLGWASYYSRNFRAPGATYFDGPNTKD